MARTVTAPRLEALTDPRRRSFARVFVEDPDSIYRDVTNLFGFNFFDGVSVTENIDQPVPSGTVTLRREHVAADGTMYSLAPTVAGSPINRNSDNEYARFLKAGRGVRVFLGWDVPDGADNYPADYLEVLRGKIDDVDWKGSDGKVLLECRGVGAWLLDKIIEVEREYGDDVDGVPMETVMQQILDDNESTRLGAVVLYVPVSPGVMLRAYKQERKGTLEALRDLAFQIGWDVRFLWQADGSYRLTLYEPDRAKSAHDWALGPANYFDVSQLKESDADVRNKIKGIATAPDGTAIEYTKEVADSIAEYDVRYMEFTEDSTSNIDTLEELTAMVDAAASDLAQPLADQEIENDLFPIAEVGDLGRWEANGKHYDSDQDLGVVQVRHEVTGTSRRTFIQSRGRVAGGGQEWLRRGKSKIDTATGDAFDPSTIYLGNFREIERQATYVKYGWQSSAPVEQIWLYIRTQTPGVTEPWPPDAAAVAAGATAVAPTRKLTGDTTELTVDIPPGGQVRYVQLEPRDASLNAGDVQRVRVFAPEKPPTIETVRQTAGPTALYTAVAFDVLDPQGLGGTLDVWTNPSTTDNADPTAAADGTLAIASTPQHVDASSVFTLHAGGTGTLLSAVNVHPGRGKRVYFKFTNANGDDTGQVSITLLTNGGIIDQNGDLLDGAIKTAAQFATGITPVQVLSSLPVSAPDGSVVLLTTDGQLYRRVSGVWTLAVPAVNITGEILAAQIADAAITTAKFAAGLRPVRILSALPGSGDVQGDTVFLTSDNKLYRWTGSAWTAVVPTTDLTGTISTAQIAANAVTTAKIAAAAVDTAQLANNAVTAAIVAAGAITNTKIGAAAVDTAQLANNAVTASIIAASAVTATQIATDAVTTPKIIAGAVVTAKIATGAVTANEIAANTITAGQITAGTITGTEIASNAITAVKIAANTITAAKIAAGTITTAEIAALTIAAGNIAAGTITGAKIAAVTITAANIAAGTITANEIAANTITAGKIAAGTITATEIATDTITAGQIAAGAVNTSELAANAVTAAKIAAGTITANEIAALTITAAQIAANTITAAKITAGTITATELAANSIVAGKIAAGAINAAAIIVDGTITAVKLSVSVLSGISSDIGVVVAGRLNSVNGHSYIDLSASGSSAFIHHETSGGTVTLEMLANGNATFGGTVSSDTFTAAHAAFSGDATFTGAVKVNTGGGSDGYLSILNGATVLGKLGYVSGAIGIEAEGSALNIDVVTAGGDVRVHVGGNLVLDVDEAPSNLQTGIQVYVNRGGVLTLSRVSVGAANSGGAGNRILIVPN